MIAAKMDAVGLMKSVTMEIKVTRAKELHWRIRLGYQIIRFACWVMGCGFAFEWKPK